MAYPLAEQKALQKASVGQEETKNIDQLIALTDYLNSIGLPSSSEKYATILDMWTEGGKPYTKFYPDKSDDFVAHFTMGKKEPSKRNKAIFKMLGRTIPSKTPDTLHVTDYNFPEDILAELAHAIQFNVPQAERDSLDKAHWWQQYVYGKDAYGSTGPYGVTYPVGRTRETFADRIYKPGESERDYPVEFEAHRIIEPLLKKRWEEAMEKDFDSAIRKHFFKK